MEGPDAPSRLHPPVMNYIVNHLVIDLRIIPQPRQCQSEVIASRAPIKD